MEVNEMSGITSTELKLPFKRKWLWIGLIIIVILICGLALLSYRIFEFPIERRLATSVHMIPGAELRYSDTTDQNVNMKYKKIIYWINSPFEQVKDYPFVTNYRESSNPYYVGHGTVTPYYSVRTYYLSELPQKEIDHILMFASDLCCYGDEPIKVTSMNFYIISANWADDKATYMDDDLIDRLDYEHLAGKETTGTYIAYTYRMQ